MIIDIWAKMKEQVEDFGERGDVPVPEGSEIEPEFMDKKCAVQKALQAVKSSVFVLRDIKQQYKEATDEGTERILLERMNKLNDQNSGHLKNANVLMNPMKDRAKKWRYDDMLKDEPEARMMDGICNALSTRIFETLRLSQTIQMEVKQICKEKVARHVSTVDPNLSPEEVNEMVNDPDAVAKLVQAKMSKAVHNQVANAMNDINEKYKELGKLENNVKALFAMIQDLSQIVKCNTEMINSIESNLEGTRDYIAKAADALERAQVEHKKGDSKMCCIVVIVIIITLVAMKPVLAIIG